MKKIIAGLIVVVIAIVLTLFIFPKKDDEVIDVYKRQFC